MLVLRIIWRDDDKEHNPGKFKFTKAYVPWEIVYYEIQTTRVEARKREKYFKTAAGRKIIKELIAKNRPGNSVVYPPDSQARRARRGASVS